MRWDEIPFVVDDATDGLFEMSEPDQDPEQTPVFRVTTATAALVKQDLELYQPSLERMAQDWAEEKLRFMQGQAAQNGKAVNSGRK